MAEPAAARWSRLITGRPLVTVLVVLTAGLAAGGLAAGLRLDTSYAALLPEGAPEVAELETLAAQAGGGTELVVSVEGPAGARLDYARRLARRLARNPYVEQVIAELPAGFFETRGLWLLGVEQRAQLQQVVDRTLRRVKARANPLYVDMAEDDPWDELKRRVEDYGSEALEPTITSPDGKVLFVLVRVKGTQAESGSAKRILDSIQADIDRTSPGAAQLQIAMVGRLLVAREEHETLSRDLRLSTTLALVLGVALITLWTRRVWALAVIGLPLALGVVFTLAAARALLGQLNPVSGFMLPVLVGLGIDFSIHLFLRYLQLLKGDPAALPERAMSRAMAATFRPCLVGAATTAAALLALTWSDYRGISESGLLAGVGVLISLALTFVLLPPLALLLTRRAPHASPQRPQPRPAPRRWLAWLMVTAAAAFACLSVALAPGIRLHNDFSRLRGSSAAEAAYDKVVRSMGRPLGPTILLVEDLGGARALERRLRPAQALARRSTDVARVLSVAALVPDRVGEASAALDQMAAAALELQAGKRLEGADAREFNRLLDALYAEPWRPHELPRAIRRRLEPRSGEGTFVLAWPRAQLNTDVEIIAWTDRMAQIKADLALEGRSVKILDERVITTRVIRMLRRDFPWMVLVASLGALLILSLHFRRPGPVLLAAGALLLGISFMLGAMRLFELEFNIFNVMILPMIVGIGVDNAIHILHHSRAGASISTVVDTVGRAVLLASGTTAVGFGAMLVADHLGIRLLGGLAQAGIAGVLVATTVVLPCVLLLGEGRRARFERS